MEAKAKEKQWKWKEEIDIREGSEVYVLGFSRETESVISSVITIELIRVCVCVCVCVLVCVCTPKICNIGRHAKGKTDVVVQVQRLSADKIVPSWGKSFFLISSGLQSIR